ncbi:tuberous sclerosis 2 protein [Scheffersomyces xylosifermentans]|uniref:tuberous sclerosis 2 protein n=1 Tax=Scheffersomyces xylosifermentans TaxID=1304137 RepID=UPI00315D0B2D
MSTHHPSIGGSGIGSVFKSLTKSLKASTKNVPVSINPTVVGGGQDLPQLFQQLKSGSLSVRTSTAVKLSESLDKYSISSIPELWYLARDMCSPRMSSSVRRVALQLLNKCIIHDDDAVGARLRYFKDIISFCQLKPNGKIDPEYDLFLVALKSLTNDGRDVHDFCIYDEEKNFNTFLDLSLFLLSPISKNYVYQDPLQDEKAIANDKEFGFLITTIDFVKNCLKFNFTLLDEPLIVTIMNRVVEIGFHTTNKVILTNILELIHSVILFGGIPMECFDNTTNFLSSLYGMRLDVDLDRIIWTIVDGLSNEDTFQLLVTGLCESIHNSELQRYRGSSTSIQEMNLHTTPINSCIGAIELVQRIQLTNVTQNRISMDFIYLNVLKAAKAAISYNIPLINSAFLRSFDRLFSKESYSINFELQFNDSFDKILPFQLWYSNTVSMYDVLKGLRINTDQDKSYISSICLSLQVLYESHELQTPKDKLVNFMIQNSQYLSNPTIKFVLEFYNEEKLCTLMNPFWRDNCLKLLNYFYYSSNNFETKVDCIRVIKEGLESSLSIFARSSINYDLILEILKRSMGENDEMLVDYLVDNLFMFSAVQSTTSQFKQLCSLFYSSFDLKKAPTQQDKQRSLMSISSVGSFTTHTQNSTSPALSAMFLSKFTKAIAKIFVITLIKEGQKAQECYEIMLKIFNYALDTKNAELLLILSKSLIRIRVTSENFIYVTQPSDMNGLAVAFKRSVVDSNLKKDSMQNYKWVYPEEVPYLPEAYFDKPSKTLMLGHDQLQSNSSSITFSEKEVKDSKTKFTINLTRWFDLVIKIMEIFVDWEVYSYIWAHFTAQLSNIHLFFKNDQQIIKLKNIVCEQLTLNLPSSIKLPNDFTKADLQVAYVRTFSALLAYHDKFSKYDEDNIVNSLIFGLSSWEKTAIPCINILTVCCYEIPLSIKKYLTVILTKLQTRVSSTFASTHALEFLMSLIHLPVLTSNFTIDEFKRVFGIAFKYIQYANDIKNRTVAVDQNNILQTHGVDAQVEETPSTQSTEITPIMSQYLLTISYNVISNWFLKINVSDRKRLSSFLVKNLILCNEGATEMDDQTIGFLDFIIRFTYSDLPLKIINSTATFTTSDKNLNTSRWIIGNSVISIDTNVTNGDSTLVIRRPTGVAKLTIQLEHEQNVDDSTNIVNSNYYLLQLFDNIDSSPNSKPIPIVEDSIVLRALSVLDRIPTVEFHKIGVVYIGKGQSKEADVLKNQVGSSIYQCFLERLGTLYKLKQNPPKIYLGGLDSENGLDGEYARYWRDKTTQIIFHTTTMMHNQIHGETDQRQVDLKKRHIGNNYVNIYFDESGLEFNFNLIKSQFNFLNIVISPHTLSTSRTTDPETKTKNVLDSQEDYLETSPSSNRHLFKVKTYRRSGVPGIFATCHFKIVSRENLPDFIRNLAIVADQFAGVWHANVSGLYTSNWSQRVKQIKILKQKTLENHEILRQEEAQHQQQQTSEKHTSTNTTQSFFEQLQFESSGGGSAPGSAGTLKAANEGSNDYKYEYLDVVTSKPGDEDHPNNEMYQLVEFNSYTS